MCISNPAWKSDVVPVPILQSSPAERQPASNMEYMLSVDNDFLGIFEPLIVVDQNIKRSGFQDTYRYWVQAHISSIVRNHLNMMEKPG